MKDSLEMSDDGGEEVCGERGGVNGGKKGKCLDERDEMTRSKDGSKKNRD